MQAKAKVKANVKGNKDLVDVMSWVAHFLKNLQAIEKENVACPSYVLRRTKDLVFQQSLEINLGAPVLHRAELNPAFQRQGKHFVLHILWVEFMCV